MNYRACLVLSLAALASSAWSQAVVLYSRADSDHARRVLALASLYEPVLIDRALPAGVPWRAAIAASICDARRVLLVWSQHAAASNEVRREIDTALVCRVLVVPVVLDNTPLPGLVGDINGADWR